MTGPCSPQRDLKELIVDLYCRFIDILFIFCLEIYSSPTSNTSTRTCWESNGEKRPVEVLDSILAESAEHLADLKHQKELAAGTHLGGWTLTRIVAVECVEEDRRPLLCCSLCILQVNV